MKSPRRSRPIIVVLALWSACASPLVGLALARPKAGGEDVHRRDASCLTCHSADRATLEGNPGRAKSLLKNDLEATCNRCHGSQGPSHKTGVRAAMNVPPVLPLASDGRLTCATCHFMHGENDRFGDFLRADNRRGQLCLSCHKLSDLK